MNNIEVTFGLMWRSYFKKKLEKLKFKGHQIEYTEQKRWLSTTFTINSDPETSHIINIIIRIIQS